MLMEFFLEKNLIYTEIQALPFTSIRGKGGGSCRLRTRLLSTGKNGLFSAFDRTLFPGHTARRRRRSRPDPA